MTLLTEEWMTLLYLPKEKPRLQFRFTAVAVKPCCPAAPVAAKSLPNP